MTQQPMTAAELACAMQRLGVATDAELARRLDVNRATVGRWLRNERSIPGPVRVLVEIWVKASGSGAQAPASSKGK